MKEIKVACKTSLSIPLEELRPIQGALKEMSKKSFKKLAKSILEDGIDFAFHVWHHDGSWYIIDGHGRDLVLLHLVEQGWRCPPIPCVETFAKDMKTARKKVLRSSSSFHKMTNQGLYEFAEEDGYDVDELKSFTDLSDIDMDEYEEEFYEVDKKKKGRGDFEKKICKKCGSLISEARAKVSSKKEIQKK